MDWKKFFAFSGKKLTIVSIILVISILTWFLIIFAAFNVTSNLANVLLYFRSIIAPFSTLSLFLRIIWIGFIFNLIYYYLLACIFIYALDNKESRRLFLSIGISLMIVLGIFGLTSLYLWQKAYVDETNKRFIEEREGPYGSLEYPHDYGLYKTAKGFIYENRLREATISCNQLSPEATFNNGENMKENCLNEVESKKQ